MWFEWLPFGEPFWGVYMVMYTKRRIRGWFVWLLVWADTNGQGMTEKKPEDNSVDYKANSAESDDVLTFL